MKTLISALLLAAVAASPAAAGERLFGAPSEPTIFGHPIATREAPVLESLTIVRQERPETAANGRSPSAPTIWGHRPAPTEAPRVQGAE